MSDEKESDKKTSSSAPPPSEKAEKKPEKKAEPKAEAKTPAKKTSGVVASPYMLPESMHSAWKIAAIVGIVGVGATASQMFGADGARASYSYVFGFYVFLTIALGSLFFVLIQHLTSAGWSVTVRRTAEMFASALPVFAILWIPMVVSMKHLYPWSSEFEEAHHAQSEGAHHGAEHSENKKGSLLPSLIQEAHAQEAQHPAQPAQPPAGAVSAEPAKHKDGSGGGHGDGSGSGHGNGSGAGHEARPHSGGEEHHAGAAQGGGPAALEQAQERASAAEEEEILEGKRHGWLNKSFFLGRGIVYFVIWSLLAMFFFRASTDQDSSKDPKLTVKQQKWAPLSTLLFGLSLTFAAFDWLMSLDPMWFSTIYGVYVFATSVVSSLAVLIVATMMLRERSAAFQKVITVEHYHDIGKLLFGFNVFWAYIGFGQMMLIWYAALPAETTYYHKRRETPSSISLGNHSGDFWTNVSVGILIGHFIVAFLFLISRNTKRRLPLLRLGAYWIILMHVVDMYWFVLPNFEPNLKAAGFSISWTDITALLGVGGVYLAVVFYRMTKHAMIPTGDPRLARSIAFVNA